MKFALDMHTHTIASGHAYNTIMEMARAAADRGLEALGITEHGPSIAGTCDEIYFKNLKVVDRRLYGVRLFLGAEMNIVNYDGGLDLSDSAQRHLDVGIAGIHHGYYTAGSIRENTQAYIKAIENPMVDIISHPDDGRIPVDYEQLALAARENQVLLELNNSSLQPTNARYAGHSEDCIRRLLEQCEKYGTAVILSSDAHFCSAVGVFTQVEEFALKAGFPERLIVNDSVQRVLPFLHKYR